MNGEYNPSDRQTDEIIYFGDENYSPKISVIMPIYNAENIYAQALKVS